MKPEKEVISHEDIKLDIAQDRRSPRGSNRLASEVRSIMITDSNSSKVKLYAFFTDTQERVRLKLGVPVNFATPRKGCVLEWESQSGVWVDIQTSSKTHFSISQLNVDSVGSSFASGGIGYTQTLKTVTNNPTDLIEANDLRVKTTIKNNSNIEWYAGTLENCNHADYKTRCFKIESGAELVWDITAALYIRTESTTEVDSMYFFEQLKG